MSDRESRQREGTSQSTSQGRSQSRGKYETQESQVLPPDIVEHYNNLEDDVNDNVDDIDKKTLYYHNPRYLISESIGRGTYGIVCSAQRTVGSVNDAVAIKMCRLGGLASTLKSMQREYNFARTLMVSPHPNIVTIYEVFYALNQMKRISRLYVVTEYTDEADLKSGVTDYNDQGFEVWMPVKEGMARHLIRGIARGVLHMKSLEICHSDIKLENALIFENPVRYGISEQIDETRFDKWTVKLTDFGNSREPTEDDPEGKILLNFPTCTLDFASPESWARLPDGNYGQYEGYSSDVFSVGICLLSLLLGALPFRPPNIAYPAANDADHELNLQKYALYTGKMKTDTAYIKHLCKPFSPPLRMLLLKALHSDPDQRITIEQFLSEPWISSPKMFEAEDVPHQGSAYYGIRPTLRTFGGKRFAEDI